MKADKEPRAGGAVIALCLIVGAVAGMLGGQPSIGLLAGLGAGIAVAVVIYLGDRKR